MFRFSGKRCLFILNIMLAFVISACSGGSSNPTPLVKQPPSSAKLVTPADDGELERWLKSELVKSYQVRDVSYYYAAMGSKVTTGGATAELTLAAAPASATSSSQASGDSSANTYSTTNVQELGVDEGDLLKTDGEYIYLVRGSRFLVLKGEPAEQAAIVSDIDLKEQISELHLANSRVTIITASYSGYPVTTDSGTAGGAGGTAAPGKAAGMASPVMPGTALTRVYNYDVSTPTAPALSSKFDFPGTLQGSRRINDTVYLITNYHIDLPSPVTAWNYLQSGSYSAEAYSQASTKASAENMRRIEALTLSDMMPTYSVTPYSDGVEGTTIVKPLVNSSDVYIPVNGNGTDLSLVIALDSAAATPVVTSSGVISSWCQIYMSPESLYLASSNSWAWVEPVQGIVQTNINPEPWTALHKFSVTNGVGKPLYKGSGMVTGWLNNQFSMGEYNGYLRIGTTRGGWWGEGISNRLGVLAEQDGTLVEKGSIEGLASGEKIYSMRFDRDRGYMVTFRQTDPLFTFDLSDPQNPRQVGELKVNGFATYIHLLGEDKNRLLTVGRSADSGGRVTGNKLQLFDVTNLAAPTLLGEYEMGSGWSTALYDYHAFLYYEGILAIPYYSYGDASGLYSSGLEVFDVGETGLSKRGNIQAPAVSSGYSYADTVDRALIIGTDIYAIAHRSVTIAGSAQLDVKKTVALPESYTFYGFGGGGVQPL